MTIKAITFDFWSTLYQSKTIDYVERMRRLRAEVEEGCGEKLDQARFKAAVNAARAAWSKTWTEEYRTPDAEEWLSVMSQHLGISLDPAHLLKIKTRMENTVLHDRPVIVDDAQAALTRLSSRYRLGLISDTGVTPGRVLRQVLDDDNLTGHFTCLTFSDEVGRSKPHPDPFLTTLGALDAEPAEAVHVGDLLRTDIAGAQAVGMRGVQYIGLNHDRWIGETDAGAANTVTPNAVIRAHTELEPLLERWNNSHSGSE